MRKFFIGLLRVIGVLAVLGIGAVIALDQYYQHVFPILVTINGVYCTGMTIEDVTEILNDSYDLHSDRIAVRMLDGEVHEIPLDEYGITVSYQPAVAKCMEACKIRPFQWLDDWLDYELKWGPPIIPLCRNNTVYPTYNCDMAVMTARLEDTEWLNDDLLHRDESTVSIVRSATAGYILVDETRDSFSRENAVNLLGEKIVDHLTNMNGKPFQTTLIDLSTGADKEICYQNIPYTDEMKETLAKWEGIREFQSFHMTYQFGDRREVIDANVVADWILLDEEGNIVFDANNIPVLDETMIAEYVAYLSATYNTVGIERRFQATRGDIVTVAGGGYGNELDEKAEYVFLLHAFREKASGTRIPQYTSEAWEKGSDDIGDTYIEVDMGVQHMYYYVDGELMIDTPVVTGNTSRRWGTPAKVCFVYFKQKNRVLRGADYATPVKYWMAVDGHIGIHDATWRKEFGEEIYKTNGSHGCINTPIEIMTELYDMVELGTPVIMFY